MNRRGFFKLLGLSPFAAVTVKALPVEPEKVAKMLAPPGGWAQTMTHVTLVSTGYGYPGGISFRS